MNLTQLMGEVDSLVEYREHMIRIPVYVWDCFNIKRIHFTRTYIVNNIVVLVTFQQMSRTQSTFQYTIIK